MLQLRDDFTSSKHLCPGTFDPGDILRIAGGIEVIHIPGYCAGQVALLWHPGRMLFAGDTRARTSRALVILSASISWEEGRASQREVASLSFDAAVFGHGEPSAAMRQRVLAKSEARNRLPDVGEAVWSQERTIKELLRHASQVARGFYFMVIRYRLSLIQKDSDHISTNQLANADLLQLAFCGASVEVSRAGPGAAPALVGRISAPYDPNGLRYGQHAGEPQAGFSFQTCGEQPKGVHGAPRQVRAALEWRFSERGDTAIGPDSAAGRLLIEISLLSEYCTGPSVRSPVGRRTKRRL